MSARPVLLVDTHSLFFRAYHALPPMNTSHGEPTRAVYGFSALLIKLLREEKPAALAFAVDRPEPTFRHERYQGYKGTRPAPPSDLWQQWPRLEALLAALGAPVLSAPRFEADDVLATLARRLREKGRPALIVSGDRDVLQTALPPCAVLFVGRRGKESERYDAARVEARFGVRPEQLPSFVAIVGDPSDNVRGVAGIGPRTAGALVRRYGTIDGLFAALPSVEPERLRTRLAPCREQLLENELILRLCDDVPLPDAPLDASPTNAHLDAVRSLFEELEFKSLLPRLDALRVAD